MLSFEFWQEEIVALLRREFGSALEQITLQEIDWQAWNEFYIQGRTPRQAIERALERDI